MTSDEIAEYRPPTELSRTSVDDWFDVFPNIIRLAEYVADTGFVPDTIRRQPGAVAATILTGRELGIPPMTALRQIFVVHGRPGLSAELMRALILRAGHELNYIEATDTRCIVEGRRNNEKDFTRVQFTIEDARKNSVDIRAWAADKLVARATSRLARRKFADVIAGLPTIDELEDNNDPAAVIELAGAVTEAPTAPVQRKRATRKAKAASTQPPTATPPAPAAPEPTDDAELLDDTNDVAGPRQPAPASPSGGDSAARPNQDPHTGAASTDLRDPATQTPPGDIELTGKPQHMPGAPDYTQPADDGPEPPASRAQHAKIQVLFASLGISSRDDQLTIISAILRYDFTGSRSKLTKTEANTIINTLDPDTPDNWRNNTDYPIDDRIRDILNEAALRQAEQEADQ